ncbi:MAG TPA: cysteine dioxygenase family protein [Candidatus Acidoferrales bacterium]|nr:cysteine dioxygenase family protein [Candidatus Acidoferrales bacterium]
MLTELIFSLRSVSPLERSHAEMARLLEQAVDRYRPGAPALVARPGGYTRTCAHFDERFEVLLLNWAPGSRSCLHDHGGQHCWLAVLDGAVRLENYDRLDGGENPGRAIVAARDSGTLERGQLDLRSAAVDLHRVSAAADGGAVTLHVYALPLREFNAYDELAHRCRPCRPRYDAVLPFAVEAPVA